MDVPLPDSLREFVEGQAAALGLATPAEYVVSLVREKAEEMSDGEGVLDRLGMTREEFVAAVEEGTNSGPSVVMDKEDWESIRREARQGLAEAAARPA